VEGIRRPTANVAAGGPNVNLDLRSTLSPRGDVSDVAIGAYAVSADTAGHSRRVRCIALALARELGLQAKELSAIGQAALFHDIGKLAIPDEILHKPGRLTDAEWALMRSHSDEGARMLEATGSFAAAVPAVRHHHERYDGTGYPGKLVGEQIPLGARVVHVADALDSMLTDRVYQPARLPAEALAELRRESGRQFCPRCIAALERIVATGSLVDLGLTPPVLTAV
jgi:putative nucleotidyltransferase with HDIG domain